MIILRDSQNAYAIWLVRGDIGRSRSYWVRYQERDVQDFLMLELKSRVISPTLRSSEYSLSIDLKGKDMRRRKPRSKIPLKTAIGCKMTQAADDMPKDTTGDLHVLSMIRDTTVRFQRLRRAGGKISNLTCGL